MNFFKTLLASILGTILGLGLLFLIFIGIIAGLVGSMEKKAVNVEENTVLHLKFDNLLTERGNDKDVTFDPTNFESDSKTGLNHIMADLEKAKNDPKVKGIFLEPSQVLAAPSTMLDVHRALEDFKSSGKWIVSYSEDFSQGAYYLASTANEIYLYPQGSLDWRGINAELMFFKKLLDKLQIDAQVIRGPNNKFKSAVEPYIYDQMSPENEEQLKTFISDIWRVMLDGISASRGISVADLNRYADELAFVQPEKAAEARMVDGLRYRDEVIAIIKSKLGIDASAKDSELKFVTLGDYHNSGGEKNEKDSPDYKKDKVAVVYAVGAIESGEGDDFTIGSERIAGALKKAREDEKVKAIVLRVNSPGGSALASDVIWRETELIRQSGKPFYVSMGDYAASGGYYISCSAEKIYANTNTITGSIGVFGIVPNMQKFWDEKLGVTFDRYETNPHADLISVNKPLDEMEMKAMQDMVTDIYDDFTGKVAKGRNMTQAQVDSIGQGRVWSGEDAKMIGLVDEIGNLQDCVRAIAEKAGMTDYAVKELPDLIDPFQKLIEDITGKKETKILQEVLGENYRIYEDLREIQNMKGIQTRLPFLIEIQ